MYPDPRNPAIEFSFEELRARHRGLLDIDWSNVPREEETPVQMLTDLSLNSPPKNLPSKGFDIFQDESAPISVAESHGRDCQENTPAAQNDRPKSRGFAIFNDDIENEPLDKSEEAPDHPAPIDNQEHEPKQRGFAIFSDDAENSPQTEPQERPAPPITIDSTLKVVPLRDENDENRPPQQRDVDLAKKLRREERANRTKKIGKIMEVEHVPKETQTGMFLNLSIYKPWLIRA